MSEHDIDIADMQCWFFSYGSIKMEEIPRSLLENISG